MGKWQIRTNADAKHDFKIGEEVTFNLPTEDIIVTLEE